MKIDSIADTSIHPSIQESFAGSADADADAVPSFPSLGPYYCSMDGARDQASERASEGGREEL